MTKDSEKQQVIKEMEKLTVPILYMAYTHRGTGSSYTTEFSYDTLDRLTLADYHINGNNEQFTLDELGNRTLVNDKNNNDITYTMANNLTNRYSSVDSASLAYDDAGNLTADEQGYQYEYDYENRIVKVKDSSNNTKAEYAYDALGRRIRKIAGSDTILYYYNNNNQVLMAFDSSGAVENNVFGNYIDEVVHSLAGYYVHDHLYSVAAVTNDSGVVQERVEYDAYGLPTFYNSDFSSSYPVSQLTTENPYLFTGRRVDFLDSGSLKLQYNRNRYYSYTLGRWLTHDPLGITPHSQISNYFSPKAQYTNGMNIYEYVSSSPAMSMDPWGLKTFDDLLNMSYHKGTDAPEDGDWEHGRWNRASYPLRLLPYLTFIEIRAQETASAGMLRGWWDAGEHLAHYLENSGNNKYINYVKMLRDSSMARNDFKTSLLNAMEFAEAEADNSKRIEIVQLGHDRRKVTDDTNWQYAIQTYHTWGQGTIEKGKGSKSCCYYMRWTQHLRDNYEFENQGYFNGGAAGLVSDHEMWLLNKYGIAKHFKIRGNHTINITWIRGYRLEGESLTSLIEGRQKPIPECK